MRNERQVEVRCSYRYAGRWPFKRHNKQEQRVFPPNNPLLVQAAKAAKLGKEDESLIKEEEDLIREKIYHYEDSYYP